MYCDYSTTTHGKWILAGEHAVLRGAPALVFPIKEKSLTLDYQANKKELKADFTGEYGDTLHVLFWSVLEEGLQLLGSSLNRVHGYFHLCSNLPVGVGLGASAALCVAMARWFVAQKFFEPDHIASFATKLESLFHGKSSGLDIVGVAATQGICFQQGKSTSLAQTWQPKWYLSSCGQIGFTSQCIQRVKELWQANPEQASFVDIKMMEAVTYGKEALAGNSLNSLLFLKKAIDLAYDCFNEWGLISETLFQHIYLLKTAGAIAVKPTGSGGGGFVLSLWKKVPPPHLLAQLIAV